MKAELREALGKAAYEQSLTTAQFANSLTWEDQHESVREMYRGMAESVIMEFASLFITPFRPVFSLVAHTLFSEDEIKEFLRRL